jgi:sec-independent protein translocase protein TatA
MFGMSPLELGVILLVVILLFGTRRLPELGSSLGQAISNFKRSFRDAHAIDVTPGAGEKKQVSDKSAEQEGASEQK